ncbi:unnamed protein product [Ectocarpus sp. 12 AP-2014]
MSSSLIQIFALMTCTFFLGLSLGFVMWRFDGVTRKALDALKTEVDFWRGSHDKSRSELWHEQQKLEAATEESAKLKRRLSQQPPKA